MPGEVRESHGQFVMILQSVNQPGRIDAVVAHQLEYEAQEFRIAGQQRVIVGRPRHEVVGQIRTTLRHLAHVIEWQRELLESKSPQLAHHVGDELIRRQRQGMTGPPDPSIGVALDAEQAVGIETQHSVPEHTQLVHRVPDHEPFGGECRVKPVERGLTLLEVVQVYPAALHAIDAPHDIRGAPVRVLDSGLVKYS